MKLYNALDNSAIRKKPLIVRVEEMILLVKLKDLSFFVMCLLFGHSYNFFKLVIIKIFSRVFRPCNGSLCKSSPFSTLLKVIIYIDILVQVKNLVKYENI